MPTAVSQAETGDLPELIRCWNQTMGHDTMSRDELGGALFADSRHTALVARLCGRVVGLVGCTAPAPQADRGHITAICAADESVTASLLVHGAELLRSCGASRVVASEFGGSPFAPGTDLRYEPIHAGFARAGFSHTHNLDDMELHLAAYEPIAYQRSAISHAKAYGAQVVHWGPELVESLSRFSVGAAASGDLPGGWFWEGWEQGPNMVVAVLDGDVIGYANYDPEPKRFHGRYHRPNAGAFGPTGVLAEHRGHGVGTWILAETSLAVKRAGREWLWAGWTNTPFYVPNEWSVCRQYAVWEKALGG